MVMKHVRIAELKAKLSEFLRAVQGGESFAVLDRNTAIAQIVPLRERPGIRIRKPASGSPTPNNVACQNHRNSKSTPSNCCLKNVKAIDDRLRRLIGVVACGTWTAKCIARMAAIERGVSSALVTTADSKLRFLCNDAT
jgi:antitoxin (DNA-binding transcriptional repressor) of toxin-antitoxin stability system